MRQFFQEIVQALDFIIKTDYPARGEYVGAVLTQVISSKNLASDGGFDDTVQVGTR
jgi:hypothetical protein